MNSEMGFSLRTPASDGACLRDDPRWREPAVDMAQMPTERMGPPPRSFAADAHDCIMVRIQTDLPHTSVRREDAPQWRAPLGSIRS